jgi:hypothetical protein
MSVDIDTSRSARWWVVPEVLVLAVLGTLVVAGPGRPADVRADLADRVAAMLEQSSPAEHHDHGHQVTAEDKVFCEAQVLGLEPPGATDVAEVRKVYANFFCAAGRPGMEFTWSSRASGPVNAGEGYEQRVRELFPDEYEDRALKASLSVEVAAEVRRRYEDAFPPT